VIGISSAFVGGNLLEGLAATLSDRANLAVGDIAGNVRDLADATAAHLTGSMAASVYVATHDGSDYGDRTAEAMALNAKAVMLEEVTPDGPNEAIVGVAASYGIYVEYGTRYAAAQPFLTPAAEAVRGNIAEHVKIRLEER
jgi:HK97 gp10 family phage protein